MLALLLAGRPALAQHGLGVGEDAFTLSRGTLRVGVGGSWSTYEERFDSSGRRAAIASAFNNLQLGTAQFPALGGAAQMIQSLTGGSFALSLGTTSVKANAVSTTTPIIGELGLANRLTVGVMVPYIVTRTSVLATVNPLTATAGFNPARSTAAIGTAAKAANAALASQFATSISQLQSRYSSCFPSGTTAQCRAVIALRDSAAAFAAAVAALYGTGTSVGAVVVPVVGSDAQNRIVARTAQYNDSLRAYLSTSASDTASRITARPFAAPTGLSYNEFRDLVTGTDTPGLGLGAAPLETVGRSHFGDIEVNAKLQWLDSFRGKPAERPSGVNLRSAVVGLVRLGTGQREQPGVYLDVGTGEGQTDLELRSTTDVFIGPSFWASFSVRGGRQLADQITVRIPDATSPALVPASHTASVSRKLGDYAEFEAVPRVALGRFFSVSALYQYRRKQADRYSGTLQLDSASTGSGAITLDAATLMNNTATSEQRLGAGFSFSTEAAYERRDAGLPLDLALTHYRTMSGRNVPAQSIDELRLRVYLSAFGRRRR